MTAEQHVVAWIESSREHYERLLVITRRRADLSASTLAMLLASLVGDAYREMARFGDATDDYTAAELLRAAAELSTWEAPE